MENKIEMLKALSDQNRYKILQLLLHHDYCVNALSKKLNISEAGISQHLKILRKAGLVWGEKRGYYTHYIVNKDQLHQLADELYNLANQKTKAATDNCFKQCFQKEGNTS